MTLKVVTVVAVVLVNEQGQILIAQRPEGKAMAGLWEFPGGKLEPGERPEHALARELDEELGITVDPAAFEPLTFASHGYDGFHLLMPLFLCQQWQGDITAREHDGLKWVSVSELTGYPMPEADIPLVAYLEKHQSDLVIV